MEIAKSMLRVTQLPLCASNFGQITVTALNRSDKEVAIEVPLPVWVEKDALTSQFGNPVSVRGDALLITVPAHGWDVAL